MDYIAQPKDYWIATNAIYINRNALGNPDRIQASMASGAVILCYIKGVKPASTGPEYENNGNGLEYDNGHNYKRWPLVISPTYFNTHTVKYVYAAIPKTAQINKSAIIVFPSEQLDIYGKNANNEQIGSTDYFYIFLQGILSSSGDDGATNRIWQQDMAFGTLSTDEAIADQSLNTDWYSYSQLTQVATFLKEIAMAEDSTFLNIRAELLELSGHILNKVADGSTPVNSDNAVATPSYVSNHFLSKTSDDSAAGKITFEKGFNGGNFVQDSTGSGLWMDEHNNWHFESDYLHARKKFTAKEVQIEDVHHVGGQQLLTAASMTCDFVVDKGGAYRCFFLRKDDDGKEITNNWMTNDQAYVNTFNLANDGETANHFLWRLVTGTSNDGLDLNTYTIDGTEYDASLYHYIDLSKTVCADGSDAPLAGDDIVQLGYRGGDSSRESAIIQAGAGEASPYIREYTGITTFSLPTPDIQLKPGDNILTGQVTMTAGSKMPDGTLVDDYVSETLETINSLDTGNENLLRNTGFTGDYESEAVESESEVFSDTVMFSDPLKHWVYSGVTVVTNGNSASGYAVQLDTGAISQTPTNAIEQDKWYCISFKASGNAVTVSCGGYAQVIPLTNNVKRYIVKFVCENGNANTFSMSGNNCLLMEIQLTQGRIPNTDWLPSPLDNDKALAYHQNLSYLTNAINEGRTDILGGLILSQMIRVGNYRDNAMVQETGGMSGLYTSNNSPFLWGGGNMQQAFYTIGKYVNNPEYQPTDEEVAQMAKFVVTHGGRAILNDIILRGYIYALGGYFRGEVQAESGVFKNVHSPNYNFIIDEDGNFECKDAKLRGNIYNPLFEINSSNKHQYLILQPGETVVYAVRLDLTGLNIQIKDNVFTGVVTINPPKTVAFNGARMNILNSSGYKIIINGGDGYTNISELATGDFGVYICYHANTTNYFWLKIN